MKRLYLIRHAKSSWADPALADFDRPLNKRGKRDAPFMGSRLGETGGCPDLIVASSARRARKTAAIIAKAVGYDRERLVLTERLYTSDLRDLLELVRATGTEVDSLALVGHNFVITEFAEWLCGRVLNNIPTCGIAAIDFDLADWRAVDRRTGVLAFFDYPKLHPDRSRG